MSDTNLSDLSAQEIAEKCAESMWALDNASQKLGMKLDGIAPGEATMSMMITDDMTNGHKTCHGGYIFTLADSCFAFACNGRNQCSVAQHCSISYVAPAFANDRLLAVAREQAHYGRSGIYDIRVTNQKGDLIAEFRGHSRTIKGTHI